MNRNEGRRVTLAMESSKGSTPASLKLPHKARSGFLSTPPLRRPSSNSSKSVGRKELYDTLTEYDRKHGSKQRSLASIVDRISDFNSDSLRSFNMDYSEFDQRLSDSLDTFQTQVESIQALKEQGSKMVTGFESDISITEHAFEEDLEGLKQWLPPRDKADMMQEKITRLREILAASKEKLKRLDQELQQVEEGNRRERNQANTTIQGILLVLAVFVILASYYLLS